MLTQSYVRPIVCQLMALLLTLCQPTIGLNIQTVDKVNVGLDIMLTLWKSFRVVYSYFSLMVA